VGCRASRRERIEERPGAQVQPELGAAREVSSSAAGMIAKAGRRFWLRQGFCSICSEFGAIV
jgi:hypothetical protein